jgi:DNA modification methylase
MTKRKPRDESSVFKNSGFKNENNNTAEANPTGRFPANLLVCDDVLNDGVTHKSGKDVNHTTEFKSKGHFGMAEHVYNKETNYGDSGSFSRYYDLDKWYKKIGEYKYNNNNKNSMLIHGDSVEELKKLDDNSVDLVVTDPPYGYSFMGKEWDKALPDKRIWKECLRVLKAGGFAYIMSAPRQDVLARMMIDLEDSGFNTAFTSMYWAYATGFPKALNISKAIDKKLGVERTEVIGSRKRNVKPYDDSNGWNDNNTQGEYEYKKPASEEAKKLDGSYAGFQPKPAVEVIIVCMKPLDEKTYLEQAMKNGKGVSWFDDCRIPTSDSDKYDLEQREVSKAHGIQNDDSFLDQIHDADAKHGVQGKGRFPANIMVSDDSLDTGKITKSKSGMRKNNNTESILEKGFEGKPKEIYSGLNDSGDFSRYYDLDRWWKSQFIITPKASKSEKNKGCEDFDEKSVNRIRQNKTNPEKSLKTGSGKVRDIKMKNNHPTVKPLKLMSYLITLGSREGDVVLDPFMGSGTTPLASKNMGRNYIGIEREEEYFKICCARVGDEPTVLPKGKVVTEEAPEGVAIPEDKPDQPDKPVEEIIVENKKLICELCKVDYTGSTKEEHEKRPFHQRTVKDLE